MPNKENVRCCIISFHFICGMNPRRTGNLMDLCLSNYFSVVFHRTRRNTRFSGLKPRANRRNHRMKINTQERANGKGGGVQRIADQFESREILKRDECNIGSKQPRKLSMDCQSCRSGAAIWIEKFDYVARDGCVENNQAANISQQ